MNLRNKILASGVTALLGACGSSAIDIGTSTVGAYTFNVAYEGAAPAAGSMTTFVIKPTAGGNPTSVTGWVAGDGTETPNKVLAIYDANDGDYDDDITCPSPMPANAKFWFDVNTNGTIATGSVALTP